MKSAGKTEATPPPEAFKPFDYSQSDLKVFAGTFDRCCVWQSGPFFTFSATCSESEWVHVDGFFLFFSFRKGTKSKDNTQFDPNRQERDFKKKVCFKFVKNCYFYFVDELNNYTFTSNRNSQRDRNLILGQGVEVCLTCQENQKGKK